METMEHNANLGGTMPEGIIEFLKVAGTGGIVFIIFYLYHQSTTKQMNEIITKTFDLLKEMIEQNTLQLNYLQKIDTKVSSNLWCPLIREKTGHHIPHLQQHEENYGE